MQAPLQIVFRGMEPSPAVEARIRERAAQLDSLGPEITRCQITVQAPHQHHHKGQLYEVRILLRVPGKDLVTRPEANRNHAHEDVYVSLRDAFDAMERQLEELARKRDHRTRPHAPRPHGTVVRHFPQDGFGFVEMPDGLEVYFHENSVMDGRFSDLQVGDEVRIERADNESEKGPQATTVRLLRRRSSRPRSA